MLSWAGEQGVQARRVGGGDRLPFAVGIVRVEHGAVVHDQQALQVGTGGEATGEPVELRIGEAAADAAGHAGVEHDDVQGAEQGVVVVRRLEIGLAAEQGAVERRARIMVAEREQHRGGKPGLAEHRLDLQIAGRIAEIGEIAGNHDKGRCRLHPRHLGQNGAQRGVGVRMEARIRRRRGRARAGRSGGRKSACRPCAPPGIAASINQGLNRPMKAPEGASGGAEPPAAGRSAQMQS